MNLKKTWPWLLASVLIPVLAGVLWLSKPALAQIDELSVSTQLRAPGQTLRSRVGNDIGIIFPLPKDILVERDVRIKMPDGTELSLNVFRPPTQAPVPVVMALTTYDKDLKPEDYIINGRGPANRAMGLDFGNFSVSEATAFEAPDPAFWVPKGYAVVYVDGRGTGKSTGQKDPFGTATVDDFARAVTWASKQPWSTGKVGTLGTSYLGAIQWLVAAANPEGLTAMIPWEGFSDMFRDNVLHGGIPETSFARAWTAGPGGLVGSHDEPTFLTRLPWVAHLPSWAPMKAQLMYLQGLTPRPKDLGLNTPDLSRIRIPLLVAASWSAQGLHSRGSFNGYMQVSTPVHDKWLYTHGRHEWTVMNSPHAHAYQLAFFDRYLKGDTTAMNGKPRVRLEVRKSLEDYEERGEPEWPLKRTVYTRLHLDPLGLKLSPSPLSEPALTQYNSTRNEELNFVHQFTEDTEITGHTRLRMWVSMDAGLDMDIFVALRKIGVDGKPVLFHNLLGHYPVASRGWLRVSERALDEKRSQPWMPVLSHEAPQPVRAGEKYPVDIEILPSSTFFEAGSKLVLTIKGRDITDNRLNQHKILFNQGRHSIWSGGPYDSHLLLPVIPRLASPAATNTAGNSAGSQESASSQSAPAAQR